MDTVRRREKPCPILHSSFCIPFPDGLALMVRGGRLLNGWAFTAFCRFESCSIRCAAKPSGSSDPIWRGDRYRKPGGAESCLAGSNPAASFELTHHGATE